MTEEWKDVPGYEGKYQASNMGNVKSIDREITNSCGKTVFLKGKILKKSKTKDGYLYLNLCSKTFKVHRVIGITFLGKKEKEEINHKDGNKENNRIDNLEICSHLHNMNHAWKNNLMPKRKGINNGRSLLCEKDIIHIRDERNRGISLQKLSEGYGVGISTIGMIVLRKSWKHV